MTAYHPAEAKLWNPTTGELLWTLAGHTHSIRGLAFSPDGSTLATASMDRTVRLWNVATGEFLRTLATLPGIGPTLHPAVAWSPDGATIATSTHDDLQPGSRAVWEVATGARLRTLEHASLFAVAFSPDGAMLATGSHDRSAKLWDLASGDLLHTLAGHRDAVTSVRFSPDGALLATGSYDQTARIWDLATGTLLHTLEGHGDWVNAVAFTTMRGRPILATASGATFSGEHTAKLWDVGTGTLLRTFTEPSGPVADVAFSPDGAVLATASEDRRVMLWEVFAAPTGWELVRTL